MSLAGTTSATNLLSHCRAVTNQSFDPKQTTMADFRKHWDVVVTQVLQAVSSAAATAAASSSSTSLSTTIPIAEQWLHRLWTLHTESTRHYHTVVHLQEMLEYWSVLRHALQLANTKQEPMIILSIYFHDAIYDPHSGTNEEDSEALWQTFAQEVRLNDQNLIDRVSQFILATKQHKAMPDDDKIESDDAAALALFLDLDLAVLAKAPEAYMAYAALIRQEYHFVPAEIYCTKRAEILQGMAAQERLFGSPVFRPWQDRARQNVQQEVALLQQGQIPAS